MKRLTLLFTLISLTTAPAFASEDTAHKTGYFIDSPVTGLYYETSSQVSGVTNKGAFQYAPGDIVSFFIGNDSSGYLLTTLSAQEVITPTLSTTKPSKSINMTRLLLSLDETPENREEIRLASKVLSDSEFQTKLKQLDLNYLDDSENGLNLDLVSAKEAVEHEHEHLEDKHLDEVTKQNIILQLNHLATHPAVFKKLHTKEIKLHGWVYDIESGKIEAYDTEQQRFIEI